MATSEAFAFYAPPIDLDPKISGQWGDTIELKNVAAHASLLPNGLVLYWGRRSRPGSPYPSSLVEHHTEPWLFNPATGVSDWTKGDMITRQSDQGSQPQPYIIKDDDSFKWFVNLFCSGHAHQRDGNLIVFGGHIWDGRGLSQTCIYDWKNDRWLPQPPMNGERWYPSAVPLPNGNTMVVAGNNDKHPQIFRYETANTDANNWIEVHEDNGTSNYPRMHVTSAGSVFMAGPNAQSEFLDLDPTGKPKQKEMRRFDRDGKDARAKEVDVIGAWTRPSGLFRTEGERQYAPSVMYAPDKIMYIGGGTDAGGQPTNIVEFIDLDNTDRNGRIVNWTNSEATNMHNARRHHNATILPDGTVLVTGGTRGPGFNNVNYPNPVHEAELFDPNLQTWARMAAEREDRCYHGTALLMPDARILSAGGGEWSPGNHKDPNAPKDSITNAQFFSPPYLFRGDRPVLSGIPKDLAIEYDKKFSVTVSPNDSIAKASLISIGSNTHCINPQSFAFLDTAQTGQTVTVTGPENENLIPAGYYMLFLLNKDGVPSVAPFVQLLPKPEKKATSDTGETVKTDPKSGTEDTSTNGVPVRTDPKPDDETGPNPALPTPPQPTTGTAPPSTSGYGAQVKEVKDIPPSVPEINRNLIADHDGPAVIVGVTPICPYGLGPCWAGAFHGLQNVTDIKAVDPHPDGDNCTAFVYLHQDIVPDIDLWRTELAKDAKGAYQIRGIEMTLCGAVSKQQYGGKEQLTIAGTSCRPEVALAPFELKDNVRIVWASKGPRPISAEEAGAYAQLLSQATGSKFEVTGPLQKSSDGKYSLQVRQFKAI